MRDYENEPLKFIIGKGSLEPIPYDDLYELYIVQNKSIKTIADITKTSSKYISKWIQKYNLKRDLTKADIIRQTTIEKYGYNNIKQIHLDKNSVQIIEDKSLLENYIKENDISSGTELSLKLGISPAVTRRKIVKYNLKNILTSHTLAEKELQNHIQKYYQIVCDERTILNGKEIDIYIPDLKIGIEFNGNFWHNENHRNKTYHINKTKSAEEKGIFLYHIFEYEWLQKRDQILNQLNNLLSINQTKIGARKCIIKEVSNKEKSVFLQNNHLQGNDKSSIKLGLYYEDKLVSIMTFCKPRFNKKYEWELSRFCSLAGCNVVGGASKLFKYFLKTYNPKSIISYSNIAHTRGNLYKTLGFELLGISEPNYVWHKSEEILTRYQCQKHKLIQQGYNGDSEVDIMTNLGYSRIYDCGNKIWIWENIK